MKLSLKIRTLLCCAFALASSALGQLPIAPLPSPSSTPASAPTSPPSPVPQSTVPTASPPTDEPIPVVITYGDGLETRVQITGGTMEPVGVPLEQQVTVSLFFSSGIPGTPVTVGLYDGGQVKAVTAPDQQAVTVTGPALPPILVVAADQTLRFSFQSGRLYGLYRALLTIGARQYLLQFYAARRRAGSTPLPVATPTATPTPDPYSTPPP